MSIRVRFERALRHYNEIDLVLSAMRNMAIIELHKLEPSVLRQVEMWQVLVELWADFSRHHTASDGVGRFDVLVAVGSERGFCGDFNVRVAQYLASAETPKLIVGSQLSELLEERSHHLVAGASVVEDLPSVVYALHQALSDLLRPDKGPKLTIVYSTSEGIVSEDILPLSTYSGSFKDLRCAPQLNLRPVHFREAFIAQSLAFGLQICLSKSLAFENQQRLQHLGAALRKLDERREFLGLKINRSRQGEIVQEIETLLLARGDNF